MSSSSAMPSSSSQSSQSRSSTSTVPEDHVALVLLEEEDSSFYLQIPLDVINSLCLRPRKYLRFLGWCILGVEGRLALEDGTAINTNGGLNCGTTYHYVTDDLDLTYAVDLEVIKIRTNVPSESTNTRAKFRTRLLRRDHCCVWTGQRKEYGAGMHIIPYKRGSEWFQLIVQNRPSYSEDVTGLDDINNIRNGVFAANQIHSAFDPRDLVILKTPNCMLNAGDIPQRHSRNLRAGVSYPHGSRYTLQWLVQDVGPMVPNNSDAAFRRGTQKPKPSELLLHYNYGAAAVKHWGRGMEILQDHANPPRPRVPAPAPAGPSGTIYDRGTTIRKLENPRNAPRGRARVGELVASEGQGAWDEDDVMLFLWGNSQAAKERGLKKVNENTRRMEQWREGVVQSDCA